MRRLVVLILVLIILFLIGCYCSILDFKWSDISPNSYRFKSGKFVAYVWNRYIDRDFLFMDPFSQTVMTTISPTKVQYDLVSKILSVDPVNDYEVNLKLLQWTSHIYTLKINSAMKFYVDPYYKDFVSFKVPPKDMYKKLKPGMYIRIYTWRDVNAPLPKGTIYTDWLQTSPMYKILILKD